MKTDDNTPKRDEHGHFIPKDGSPKKQKFLDKFDNAPTKPMLIVKPGEMDEESRDALRANGICVVIAQNPEAVRFVDPIPSASSRTQIEHAAIQLSRRIFDKSK